MPERMPIWTCCRSPLLLYPATPQLPHLPLPQACLAMALQAPTAMGTAPGDLLRMDKAGPISMRATGLGLRPADLVRLDCLA